LASTKARGKSAMQAVAGRIPRFSMTIIVDPHGSAEILVRSARLFVHSRKGGSGFRTGRSERGKLSKWKHQYWTL